MPGPAACCIVTEVPKDKYERIALGEFRALTGCRRPARCAFALAATLAGPFACAADYGGFLAVTSDYVYRGVSLSDDEPTIQADAHYYDPRGWIAGVWASGVRPDPDLPAGVEMDPYLGFATRLDDAWEARFEGAFHAYLGRNPGARVDYLELSPTLSYRSRWFLTLVVSPDALTALEQYRAGRRVALAGELSWHEALQHSFSMNLGVGYYHLRNVAGDGYAYGSAGLAYDHGSLHADLSLVGVSREAEDIYYHGAGSGRLVGTLLWRF